MHEYSLVTDEIMMSTSFNISSLTPPLWLLTIFGFATAFIITYMTIPSIVLIARKKRLYATPNGRTSHNVAIPLLGGVGIFAGFILSTLIISGTYFKFDLIYIFSGLFILFIAGIKDDILELHPRSKLAVQIVATALIAVLADIRINDFHGLFTLHQIPYVPSILLTIFVFIVIINGYNLIDGIDGLASGIGILTSSVLGFWFWRTGNVAYTIMSFALAGSLIAFFQFNVFSTKNKIFMGDTGSLTLGLIMSILTIRFLQMDLLIQGNMYIQSAPAVAVGLLIIPLFDSLRVFVLRIKQGKSPFAADRQHIHHLLLRTGMNHLQATFTLLTVNLAFVFMCYALQGIGILWLMLVMLGTALLLTQSLIIYSQLKTRKMVDAEYLAVKNVKILIENKKLQLGPRASEYRNMRRLKETNENRELHKLKPNLTSMIVHENTSTAS
jgi:UDP-GlcNAc:undecaprenyl-phosphate GlcNAc-1-phosphate transferase